MAFRVLIILLLTYSFSFANDNKCISCHENVCSDKPYTCTTCHRGESTTMRKDIAHYKLISGKYASFTDKSSPKTQNGIELIKDAACTRCHNIGTSGATLASDLNSAVKRLTTDELIKAIKEPVINMPDFVPELYCTKRVNNKAWTKKWLEVNGFPDRPIYQMYYQKGNKADMIKGKVDVFVDDSFSNVLKCQKSGLPALLFHTERTADNPLFKVFSLTRDEITDAYNFLKTYGEGIF